METFEHDFHQSSNEVKKQRILPVIEANEHESIPLGEETVDRYISDVEVDYEELEEPNEFEDEDVLWPLNVTIYLFPFDFTPSHDLCGSIATYYILL